MVARIQAQQKKSMPSPAEQAFIETARSIYAGTINAPDQMVYTGKFKDTATALLDAMLQDGKEGYERSYTALSARNPHLKTWKPIIETPPGEIIQLRQPAPVGTLLSDVQPQKIKWLWKNRLAIGKMTMLDGDPGLGKSLITVNIAARVTTGREMPDGTPGLHEPGGVVIITPEDGLEDTIQPRFARAGANLRLVNSIGTIDEVDPETGYTYKRPFTLPGDLHYLEDAIKRVNAKLVIIDPIMGIIGGLANTSKDNEVRALLTPIQMLIEKAGAACILVRHVTKARNGNPLLAGGGSIAFIGLCRLGLMVMPNPDDPDEKVLTPTKSNLGKMDGLSLGYSVHSDEDNGDERPYVVWHGKVDMSATELLSVPAKNTGNNRQELLNFIKGQDADGVSVQAIAEEFPDMTMGNLKMTLKRMYDKGEIDKTMRGCYCGK